MDDRTKVTPPTDAGPVVRPQRHRQFPPAQPPSPSQSSPAAQPAVETEAPRPAPVEDKAEETWPLVVKLGKPIEIMGTDGSQVAYVDALEFREPTAEDLIKTGIVATVMDYRTGETKVYPEAMTAMMARLSNKPPYYFGKPMHPSDWANCAALLERFFLPNFARMS